MGSCLPACLPEKGFGLFLAKWYLRGSNTQPAHLFSLSKPFFTLTSLGKPSLSEYPIPTSHSHQILVPWAKMGSRHLMCENTVFPISLASWRTSVICLFSL